MPELYKGKIPIIRRSLNEGFIRGDVPASLATGCVPRDYDVDPVEMRDSPSAMTLYDESEWDALYDKGEEAEDSLEHLFLRGGRPAFENLDQNGDGDCWAYSTGHAVMFDRLKQNLPFVKLNPHGVAAMTGRLDGGWCGLSMKFVRENGIPAEGTGPGEWPKWSHNRKYDTPECRAQMARRKALEDWYDLGRREWDQSLSKKQIATCLFNNNPTPLDFNEYSHSMLGVRFARIARGDWGHLILNSWKGFGYFGLALIALSAAKPDGAVSLRSSTPSVS